MRSRSWRHWAVCIVLAVALAAAGSSTSLAAAATTTKPYIVVLRGSVADPGAVAAAQGKKYGAAYNQANPGYGFVGDPAHPISGRYYGWLIRAGLY